MTISVINYLIRSAISLWLLYFFFSLVLSKEHIYVFNRFYLLFSVLFSLFMPLIQLPVFQADSTAFGLTDIAGLQNNFYQIERGITRTPDTFNLNRIIITVYALVFSVLFTRFLSNLIQLAISKTKSDYVVIKGHKVILKDEPVLPYSFFSTVFVNINEYREGRIPDELFSHEFAHVSQRHSADIVIIELLKVVFWFNPVFAFYKRAILLNHEYLADEAVIKSARISSSYNNMLLNMVSRNNNTYLASSFNYSFTKKRLLMMTKKGSFRKAILKKIAVIPLFLVTGFLVIDAQDTTRRVVVHIPPPPPPPPPPQDSKDNMWWNPILRANNIIPDPSKSAYTQTFFETGDEFSMDNDIITMKNAFIVVKSVDNLYRIIRAKSATHDYKSNFIKGPGAKVETYKQENNTSSLINTVYFKDFSFRLSDGIIAPPPPPPPPEKNM